MLNPESSIDPADLPIDELPLITSKISVFSSAVATYYAPSDLSGKHGMLRERIRSTKSWRKGPPRKDCIFAEKDPNELGFRGLYAARVLLFFSFDHDNRTYPCALVHWFSHKGDVPCPDTGMWVVEPDLDEHGCRVPGVIHLDAIVHGAHLIPVFGEQHIPKEVNHTNSLDIFRSYFVNKYADHHCYGIAF